MGSEIEFASEDCADISRKVQELFEISLERINSHYYKILDSRLGALLFLNIAQAQDKVKTLQFLAPHES